MFLEKTRWPFGPIQLGKCLKYLNNLYIYLYLGIYFAKHCPWSKACNYSRKFKKINEIKNTAACSKISLEGAGSAPPHQVFNKSRPTHLHRPDRPDRQ